ncbi:MAG: sigma-54 dependent transcriptional regulator [Pseudomonadota bacterium]
MRSSVLVVDDDPVQRRLLEASLARLGHDAVTVENGEAALAYLSAPEGSQVSAILLDLVMPEMDGMTVLTRLRERQITTPVIVQTSQGSIDTVVSAMRLGATDFVVKPVSPERLRVSLGNALKMRALEDTVSHIKRSAEGQLTITDIVTRSQAMARVMRLAERAAKSQIPILIEGESGVGKEMLARAIKGSSSRRNKPLVTVNCGAIPEKLVESVLFGHEKGAFTGATEKHTGKFAEAHGGTLFLDEIGELPLDIQVKLLRALQDGEIDPIGAKSSSRADFRLISATNKPLIDQTRDGLFREDLYYRLNVFPIWIPPLRERADDIPYLAQHFLVRFAAEEGKRNIRGISAPTMDLIMHYAWPGNIRQLENAIFRAVVLCDGDVLTPAEFPQIAARQHDTDTPASATALNRDIIEPSEPSPVVPMMAGTEASTSGFVGQAVPSSALDAVARYGMIDLTNGSGAPRALEELEEEAIRFAISHLGGHMSDVARSLRIGRSTLYRKLSDYAIDPANPQQDPDAAAEKPSSDTDVVADEQPPRLTA